jgi:hypothetical protein
MCGHVFQTEVAPLFSHVQLGATAWARNLRKSNFDLNNFFDTYKNKHKPFDKDQDTASGLRAGGNEVCANVAHKESLIHV